MDYKVKLLSQNKIFQGYFQVHKYCFSYRQFDGEMSPTVEREVFERGHAVAVLPYDPIENKVVLIEQFRPGKFIGMQDRNWLDKSTSPWMYEIVAGIIDDGENIKDVAVRETTEETNLTIDQLEYIQAFFVSPGAVSEYIHLFVAKIDSTKAGGVFGLKEEAEDIKTHIFSCDDIWAMLDEGSITNATALIALQWLRTHQPNLKKRWLSSQ